MSMVADRMIEEQEILLTAMEEISDFLHVSEEKLKKFSNEAIGNNKDNAQVLTDLICKMNERVEQIREKVENETA